MEKKAEKILNAAILFFISQGIKTTMDDIAGFSFSGHFKLCEELRAYNFEIEAEYARYMRSYELALSKLINHGLSEGLFKDGLDTNMIYHYINMGIVYYQQNPKYRDIMNSDVIFRQQFMSFHIGHIFKDAEALAAGL